MCDLKRGMFLFEGETILSIDGVREVRLQVVVALLGERSQMLFAGSREQTLGTCSFHHFLHGVKSMFEIGRRLRLWSEHFQVSFVMDTVLEFLRWIKEIETALLIGLIERNSFRHFLHASILRQL